MAYVIEPSASPRAEVRRVAAERLGDAIDRLDAAIAAAVGAPDAEETIHEVRKRCKEVRGLARLVRPALGKRFGPFDRTVRSAARQLSALRDAHAVLATFDTLVAAQDDEAGDARHDLREVRAEQAALADAATDAVGGGDDRLHQARELLGEALEASQRWKVPAGFDALGEGLGATYDLGRTWLRRAEQRPTDGRLHEWRKAVKYLWYQARLLHDVAPSVMGPLVDQLDDLADALGDDHDLAVLVERLGEDTAGGREGDDVDTGDAGAASIHAVEIARTQQAELRRRAFRAGHTIYAESERAFVARIERYWNDAVRLGPEVDVGGIALLSEHRREQDDADRRAAGGSGREVERKFLLEHGVPDDVEPIDSVEIRQGYLAVDGDVSVRVRAAGACTLTVKWRTASDRTGERGELEWTIPDDRFEAAWPATEGRRVVKTRDRVRVADHTAEIDVFHEQLEGLIVVEVEFASVEEMEAFEPPGWFGDDVTDDDRYTNAALAVDGIPPR